MSTIQEALQRVGLTDSEIKAYLALLERGVSTRSAIVKDAGISGSKVYDILERLQQKGLVSIYVQDKIKHFRAVDPRQIYTYVEEKRASIDEAEDSVKEVLPRLLAAFQSSKEDQEVELLSGIKGMSIIFREQVDLLKKGETCYVIGGTQGTDEEAVVAFFQKIHLMREQKGIRSKMLYNERQRVATKRNFPKSSYPLTDTKYIIHSSPVAINIYHDRTAIIIFGKAISTIHIRSRDVAKSFMEYFDLLWKSSKQ